MWFLIIALALVGLYELEKNKSCSRGSCASGAPATCCCTPPCCAPPCCTAGSAIPGCCGTGANAVTCCGITNDPSTWPSGDAYWTVCQAIATAEGANVAGSAPDRYNNPGDLSRGDEHGQPVSGYVTLGCGEDEIVFQSKTAGWNALYLKIKRAAAGESSAYSPTMTWQQFAQKYAGNSAAWVTNVCAALGVSPTDTFGSYFTCG